MLSGGVFCPSRKFLITRLLTYTISKWLEDAKDDSIKLQLRPAQELLLSPGAPLALIWGQTPGLSAHLGWGLGTESLMFGTVLRLGDSSESEQPPNPGPPI